MSTLCLIQITNVLIRLRHQFDISAGIRLTQGLAPERNRTVRISGLMTINGKIQRSLIPHTINIDRSICIIGKYKIHQAFCNGCILGRIHIGDQHGMIVTLVHLKFCFQDRIIKGRGNLTDTTAISVHHLAALIGGSRIIAVIRIERCYCCRH